MRARNDDSTHGLRHLALKTCDLAATTRFYVDVLGLEIAFPHRGMLFLTTPGGDDLLNFMTTRKPFDPAAGGFDHFGIHIGRSQWRTIMQSLQRAGVPIVSRRGAAAVYVKDPNGYTVELYRD